MVQFFGLKIGEIKVKATNDFEVISRFFYAFLGMPYWCIIVEESTQESA